ncbi:hypothetical protein G9464_06965 [Halostella sp. JP-L12]|uniref:BsuPI-related putative proteinase inhibitor n=1 Tax=Halostella TaxID=1843185 RepID=UPI000EF75ED2|nr:MULTISPECIES: BsuPI-related putative proteinase inhibitor [Halostella]NHN47336.1 hypothetical protein [Halostella sp. JP-L12]
MSLHGTLDATVDDGVQFTFTVANDGDEPVDLSFSDTLEADFAVRDDGGEVWRFSEGRMFAQMLGSETIDPGGTATYEATWEDPAPGEYAVVATLEAREKDCEAETAFSV